MSTIDWLFALQWALLIGGWTTPNEESARGFVGFLQSAGSVACGCYALILVCAP